MSTENERHSGDQQCIGIVFNIGSSRQYPSNVAAKIALTCAFQALSPHDSDVAEAYARYSMGGGMLLKIRRCRTDLLDVEDIVGAAVRQEHPDTKIVYFGQNLWIRPPNRVWLRDPPAEIVSDCFRCVFVFPRAKEKTYWRTDMYDPPVTVPFVDSPTEPTYNIDGMADVRDLLGCQGYTRVLTISAGSPGWDAISDESTIGGIAQSKNQGTLNAGRNDFNTLIDVLQKLTTDDVLKGITSMGLVTKKGGFLRILSSPEEVARSKVNIRLARSLSNSLSNSLPENFSDLVSRWESVEDTFSGAVLMENSKLPNVTFSDGGFADGVRLEGGTLVLEEGARAVGITTGRLPFTTERFVSSEIQPKSEAANASEPYTLLFYSGHGSPEGNLQIEREHSITPQEIFVQSQSAGVPYVIILDMCYAHVFGEKYQALMHDYNWPGLVIASHDGSLGDNYSYESDKMCNVQRSPLNIKILKSDFVGSHGVFITAFYVGICKIAEKERELKTRLRIPLRMFNDELLIPICRSFYEVLGVPLQKPKLYCFEPKMPANRQVVLGPATYSVRHPLVVNSTQTLFTQLEVFLGKGTDFSRLVPVGPHEIQMFFSQYLKLKPGSVPIPPFPYSATQLRNLIIQLEEEESQVVLTLDLPEIGGQPTNLYSLAEWFGYHGQDPSLGKVYRGLLNLTAESLSSSSFRQLVDDMGIVSSCPRWRIRYLNLPDWGANKTYKQQTAEVHKRGYLVPSAIADVWSMLISRLYLICCGLEHFVMRADHCGRTSTVIDGCPVVIYNLQYGLGLHIGRGVEPNRADGGTYVCSEISPA